jgi:hypothetical protein
MADKEVTQSTFSAKEMEYMGAAMMSLKDGVPTVRNPLPLSSIHTNTYRIQAAQIDTAKFSKIAGLTEGSSKTIWGRIRRKLVDQANANGDGVSTTPKPAKETKPRKTPASKRKTEAGEDGDVPETPSKKPRAKKAKAELVKQDDGDAVNDENTEKDLDEEAA